MGGCGRFSARPRGFARLLPLPRPPPVAGTSPEAARSPEGRFSDVIVVPSDANLRVGAEMFPPDSFVPQWPSTSPAAEQASDHNHSCSHDTTQSEHDICPELHVTNDDDMLKHVASGGNENGIRHGCIHPVMNIPAQIAQMNVSVYMCRRSL